ncbi:tyrosine-type recombinase/integrase [Abyssalbus ytuae]|uniref:tyrosine-type recombinase/integrase n=1 Tax=Abyssalbus ytuae TaxID=2926907 RepID=UPI0034E1A6A0
MFFPSQKSGFFKNSSVKTIKIQLFLNDVKLLLSSIKSVKYKTLLNLIYSCGLRISEAINLKINSVDLQRILLYVIVDLIKKYVNNTVLRLFFLRDKKNRNTSL